MKRNKMYRKINVYRNDTRHKRQNWKMCVKKSNKTDLLAAPRPIRLQKLSSDETSFHRWVTTPDKIKLSIQPAK